MSNEYKLPASNDTAADVDEATAANNTINKTEMKAFLEFLSADKKLVGPVDTGKVIEFREAPAADILMDDLVSYISIKEYYFPQSELMFTFENDDITDKSDMPGYIIFGAKPCDLEALRVMSIVYSSGKYADPFFQRRFDANFLIGIGCKNRKPECFCDEMGINMEFSDFCDIILVDEGDSYRVALTSEKGQNALNSFYSAKSKTAEPSPCLEPVRRSSQVLPTSRLRDNGIGPLTGPDTEYFECIDWATVTQTCRGCGICTYVCPTCYCFNFRDVCEKGEAKRYKCWDSCMYPKFTLHASGHNPREQRFERYRQRVLHKYKYVPDNFEGAVACTGCGRCVRGCPVGINIKEILMQVKAASNK